MSPTRLRYGRSGVLGAALLLGCLFLPVPAAGQLRWTAGPEVSWSEARRIGIGGRLDAPLTAEIRAYLQGAYYLPDVSRLVEPEVEADRKRIELNLNVVREPVRWRGWFYLGAGLSWEWRSLDVAFLGVEEGTSTSDWAVNALVGLRRPGPGWVPHVEVKRELWRFGLWVVTAGASVPVG
ncbi:MAG: hypothetical protein HKN73_02180 [Gemmatimonadetes bacterium]|nr:hypothetical protein [Gemmatimonadota bacterium]